MLAVERTALLALVFVDEFWKMHHVEGGGQFACFGLRWLGFERDIELTKDVHLKCL